MTVTDRWFEYGINFISNREDLKRIFSNQYGGDVTLDGGRDGFGCFIAPRWEGTLLSPTEVTIIRWNLNEDVISWALLISDKTSSDVEFGLQPDFYQKR